MISFLIMRHHPNLSIVTVLIHFTATLKRGVTQVIKRKNTSLQHVFKNFWCEKLRNFGQVAGLYSLKDYFSCFNKLLNDS